MENKANKKNKIPKGEDTTKYGEFISSFFAWIPLEKQKEKAEDLSKMGKKDKKQ